MCGIIATLGKYTDEILLTGLKQLQNRGYDSAGIATIKQKTFEITKYASTNKSSGLSKLESKIYKHKNADIGIGHTRWATHGNTNDINSHPHMSFDGKFTLVHNGIIENYMEIKTNLSNKGIPFISKTDTEVIVNLLAYNYDNEKKDNNNVFEINMAIKNTVNTLEGTWGLVIMCVDSPKTLFCTRNGSPILVGHNSECAIISSEKSGFSSLITNYLVLENNDVCHISMYNDNINVNTE